MVSPIEKFIKGPLGAAIEGTMLGSDIYLVSRLTGDVGTGLLAVAALFCAQNALIVATDIMDKRGVARIERGWKQTKIRRTRYEAREREIIERADKRLYDDTNTE